MITQGRGAKNTGKKYKRMDRNSNEGSKGRVGGERSCKTIKTKNNKGIFVDQD